MFAPAYPPLQYDGGVPMYAPGTPLAVAPTSTYELIPHRIFVGGFPASTTEVELRQHFEQFFHIREAKVIRSAEGSSKGYGFISFDTEEEAENAKNLGLQTPEKLEFKGRRLNIGPALRRMGSPRYTEYAIATPTGVVSSPTMGYNYSFPPQASYVMMGTPQPTAFVYNTPTQSQPFVYPNGHVQSPNENQNVPISTDHNASSPPSTPSKQVIPQQQPMTPVPQHMYTPPGHAYYLPVPGTPTGMMRSPPAVYSPAPYYMQQAPPQDQMQCAQMPYYYPHQAGVVYQTPEGPVGPSDHDLQQQCWPVAHSGTPTRSYAELVSGRGKNPETPRSTRTEVLRTPLRRKPQKSNSCGDQDSVTSSSNESPARTLLERRIRDVDERSKHSK